jgi:hypothetical protein
VRLKLSYSGKFISTAWLSFRSENMNTEFLLKVLNPTWAVRGWTVASPFKEVVVIKILESFRKIGPNIGQLKGNSRMLLLKCLTWTLKVKQWLFIIPGSSFTNTLFIDHCE